jgi:hypothetical protein
VRAGILLDAAADETARIETRLSQLIEADSAEVKYAKRFCLPLVDRIDIKPGEICTILSGQHLAKHLEVDPARIEEALLTIKSTFQHRKRGVETKLIIGDNASDIDATLLRNIARAHRYFDLVRSGKTFGEIAETEGVSKRRIQHLIELAFLAPDVIRAVREGRQPVAMTSDWLKRHAFPPIWSEQREIFSTR